MVFKSHIRLGAKAPLVHDAYFRRAREHALARVQPCPTGVLNFLNLGSLLAYH